ncbi:NRK1 like protein [Aspergillus parasiticus SU-1]|uniref:NRK1 like protein n=1 Tax=Aspergillus parasiticus (strain ATCC 56775 / NRRL 5862 / SRRC 143 / SU-1) TaxID=1403190 RepID=A0A0F0IF39_ASPPU|nr:NRK1 like protein [Aspergillus parasiticus SU-1]
MTSQTGVIGISGPSSSGKTTLARLLQRIFSKADECLFTFIVHEDDFYFPDDRPPESEDKDHVLRPVHENIDVHLFLPAPYDMVKSRREGRSGYVTSGPAPEPTSLPQRSSVSDEVDLEGEDDRPPQNFWTDPPGYVDDIVWPRYVQDHAWLILPEGEPQKSNTLSADSQELINKVGQGVNLRTNAGVIVAPGEGTKPMVDILKWAVEEVLKYLERNILEVHE